MSAADRADDVVTVIRLVSLGRADRGDGTSGIVTTVGRATMRTDGDSFLLVTRDASALPPGLTNTPKALEGGGAAECLLRLSPVLIGMLPGPLVGVAMLLIVKASVAKLLTGFVVLVVGSLTLFKPEFELPSKTHTPMGLLSGFSGGVLGGLAAMPGPLVFTYLLAKGLRGRTFTKEASMFLVVSALLLAGTLTWSQRFDLRDLVISVAAVAP